MEWNELSGYLNSYQLGLVLFTCNVLLALFNGAAFALLMNVIGNCWVPSKFIHTMSIFIKGMPDNNGHVFKMKH